MIDKEIESAIAHLQWQIMIANEQGNAARLVMTRAAKDWDKAITEMEKYEKLLEILINQ